MRSFLAICKRWLAMNSTMLPTWCATPCLPGSRRSSKPREVAIQQKLEEYRANGMDDHSLNIYRFRMETEGRQTQEQPVYLGRRRGPIIRRR